MLNGQLLHRLSKRLCKLRLLLVKALWWLNRLVLLDRLSVGWVNNG
jgi:hypothetical protein